MRLALQDVMKNDGDFVEIIVLYKRRKFLDRRRKNKNSHNIFLLKFN